MIQEKLSQIIPNRLKPLARITYKGLTYPYRSLSDFKIRRIQEKLLKQKFSPKTQNLIIFLTPGYDILNGMVLAIYHHYIATKKLRNIHGSEVIMCTLPGDPLLLKYTKFNFDDYLYDLSMVLDYFQNLQNLIIHVTIGCLPKFLQNLSVKAIQRIKNIENVHINILIQHIGHLKEMQELSQKRYSAIPLINRLKELKLGKLTATTAHEAYTTYELRKKLGFPLHKLGVFISPEFYERKSYKEKENLMIVSPDPHPMKSEILARIRKQFPELKIQIIKNIPYEDYKSLITKAKWSLTFGEGLDGYFIEAVFSGGISFAVYNSEFFTEDFRSLRMVYDSYDTMAKKICVDMKELDNERSYTEYQTRQYTLCRRYYNYENYLKNLELFYKGEYTYE